MKSDQHNTILIVGASRGLAMLWRRRSCSTAGRSSAPFAIYHPTRRSTTAKTHPLRLRPATLDIRDEAQLAALQATLPRQASICCLSTPVPPIVTHRRPLATSPPRSFTGDAHKRPAPMRVIERLQQAVKPQGLLGVMSSGRESDQ